MTVSRQEVFVEASYRILRRTGDMDALDAECALNDALNFLKDNGYRIVRFVDGPTIPALIIEEEL